MLTDIELSIIHQIDDLEKKRAKALKDVDDNEHPPGYADEKEWYNALRQIMLEKCHGKEIEEFSREPGRIRDPEDRIPLIRIGGRGPAFGEPKTDEWRLDDIEYRFRREEFDHLPEVIQDNKRHSKKVDAQCLLERLDVSLEVARDLARQQQEMLKYDTCHLERWARMLSYILRDESLKSVGPEDSKICRLILPLSTTKKYIVIMKLDNLRQMFSMSIEGAFGGYVIHVIDEPSTSKGETRYTVKNPSSSPYRTTLQAVLTEHGILTVRSDRELGAHLCYMAVDFNVSSLREAARTMGRCWDCLKPLTNTASMDSGMGAACYKKRLGILKQLESEEPPAPKRSKKQEN